MWKKTLVIILAAIFSLTVGFAVGFVVQNGGFAGLPDALGFGAKSEKENWEGKTLTTGENIVNVRVSPQNDAEVIATLNKNTEVRCIKEESSDWCYIEVMDGVEGYVVSSFMTMVGNYEPKDEADPPAEKEEPKKTSYVSPTGDYVNIRTEASTDAEVSGMALNGDVLEKVSEEEGWIKVKNADGLEGYVSSDRVAENTEATAAENAPRKKVEITNSYANIRAESNSDSSQVTKMNRGETATYLGEESGWYYMLLDDGRTGYVRNDLADVVE